MDRDFYSFVRLSDLNLNLTFRISFLQGKLDRLACTKLLEHPESRHWGAQESQYPDLVVECRLFSENKPLSMPVKTAYKSFRNNHQWNEWITLPYKLCDLPLGAQLTFTIYDVASSTTSRIIGGTTLSLFSKKGTLKSAQHRLFLWKGVKADGSVETATPSKVGEMKDEMGRLEKLIKRHERGDLPRVDWLDKLAYRQVEKVYQAESQSSERLFLYIDLPRFELPIVYCEAESVLPSVNTANGLSSLSSTLVGPSSGTSIANNQDLAGGSSQGVPGSNLSTTTGSPLSAAAAAAAAAAAFAISDPNRITSSLFTIFDPDIFRSNPVEAKHRRLVRSHRSGPLDRELKPSAEVRDELNEILSYPPTRVLTPAEMDRVWSFRFYLTRDPKGLTKFLKSVVWTDQGEAKQATEVLLPMWTEPGLDDALELLGPTFGDPRVRSFAVRQLERAEDEELILYLLQLVQALKFEETRTSHNAAGMGGSANGGDGERPFNPRQPTTVHSPSNSQTNEANEEDSSGLAEFLIRRGLANPLLGNDLYWYLEVECEDPKTGTLFKAVKRRFLDRLSSLPAGAKRKETLTRQATLLATLSRRAKELRSNRDARPKKIEKLRSLIADPKNGLREFDPPLMLPLDARVKVTGIVSEKSTIFKSNLFPLRLEFTTAIHTEIDEEDAEVNGVLPDSITSSLIEGDEVIHDAPASGSKNNDSKDRKNGEGENYTLIFKNGDDLRQDQLVIQLFSLMDRLLRNENLDLKMTPYRVLATGSVDGMVQFVDSLSIAAILSAHQGSLLNFLRAHHPSPSSIATYGLDQGVFETFIRSCAGYCVVTYLLGVGDRHLDNLLLSSDGHFFHVDFGYILGRDPKPFPPPVKVCKEMVDAMGGTASPHYGRFKAFCYTAFTNLRKNANLILNLVALMVDANIPDIRLEPDKAVLKVQDKFLLHLSEDEAIKEFEGLLNETSYLSTVFDRLHDMAQYFRQ
ncbi:related to phosphatidylinositol 3-kinase [Melanopsichium pennsylvanicum]|uniref:Phosphatidylinositol 3-kinase VPS34 n=2 Tax=Melanopsichium pennsylvanicum TaxID=63383 RepID=A0AAJ4XGQ2_9BASI|nr:related to phosphatidylinositol 3-kinase [Melanopsichium pennsylvanicum 4]SNX81777.1 related to phosphatidylinositol 3-kinase [Melanopsichium pennsylvanicum]